MGAFRKIGAILAVEHSFDKALELLPADLRECSEVLG